MSLQLSKSQSESATATKSSLRQISSAKRYSPMQLVEKSNPSDTFSRPATNSGILSIIGNTPLVQLSRVYPDAHFNLFAKLEMFNPGGSVKDRPAVNMLKQAFERGDIAPGSTIVTVPLPITCSQPSLSTIAQVSSSIPMPRRSG